MTVREYAINMVKPYIERGDSIEHMKSGQMGVYSDSQSCQIGGYVDNKHYSNDFVISKNRRTGEIGVFKLKDLYEEVLSKQLRLV